MKRILSFVAALATVLGMHAQTMNIVTGNVKYAITADDAGKMAYKNGESLTVGLRTYNLNDITRIDITEEAVTPATVTVNYNGNQADVTVSGDIAPAIQATVNGAHVKVIYDGTVEAEITYVLSGQSDNGSFFMDSEKKATVELRNLTLTCPDSAAINIQSGKKTKLYIAKETVNYLADGLTNVADDGSDCHKAPLVINGKSEWRSSGQLTIIGNVHHGVYTDAGVDIGEKVGIVKVEAPNGDGFHVNEFFLMDGGNITVNAGKDIVDVEKKKSSTDENNGGIIVNAGSLMATTPGTAAKGMKCEGKYVMTGGTIDITTTGDGTYETVDGVLDLSSCAGVKCDETFNMSGGTLNLCSTGSGGKGINADGDINIEGGTVNVVTIGSTYVYGSEDSKPQGVKSDGNITLAGGTILVCASSDSGTAFKVDGSTTYVFTNGATVMGVGGKAVTPSANSTTGYKKYKDVDVKGGQTLSYDGVSFTIPQQYNNSSAKVLVSAPGM